MLYLYIDKNQIKLLAAKKSLFSQYSIGSFEKTFQVDLIKNGKVANIDVLASAVKEVLQNTPAVKDRQVMLILPQNTFKFIRTEVPSDIAPAAIDSFIKDKIATAFAQNAADLYYDYFFIENGPQKYLSLFTVETETVAKYQEMLKLLDLEMGTVLPETLAYFKLFEKTLRKGKIENILYGKYEKSELYTYLYDSFGLLEEDKHEYKLTNGKSAEGHLKQKGTELEKKGRKINRLILSGINSDTVRQDTFTKEVGMWTNPLKRIIPQFYQEYTKMLVTADNAAFSVLDFDMCLGAFIFSIENKGFSPLKRKYTTNIFTGKTAKSLPSFKLPSSRGFAIPKELWLFIASFILSFGLFSLLNRSGIKISLPTFQQTRQQPTTTPTPPPPTATPTPAFAREDLNIKILNGSGTAGKASEVRDVLADSNYGEIVTGNADSFDYEVTEIQVKPSKKAAAVFVTDDLQDYVENPRITELDEDEAADITIIVGQDFK